MRLLFTHCSCRVKVRLMGDRDLYNLPQLTGDVSRFSGMTKLTKLNLFKLPELTGDVSSLSGMTELKSLNLFVLPELTGDVSSFRVDRSVGARDVILMFQLMPRFQQFGYDIKCCRVHPLAYARFIRILVLFQPLISGLVNSPSRTQPWRMNSFRVL